MHCSSMRPARGDIPPDWQSDGVFSRPTISRAIFEILHCPCEAAPARSRPSIHVHTRALADNSATDMVPLGEGKRSAARADFSPSLPPVSPRTAALHKLYCPHAPTTYHRPSVHPCRPALRSFLCLDMRPLLPLCWKRSQISRLHLCSLSPLIPF